MVQIRHIDLPTAGNIFKCFSDESRVRILHLIYINQEMCISDLEVILDFTQTKTSRQLIYLKKAGLLKSKKIDQWVYYYLNESYLEIIKQLFLFLEEDPQLIKDLQEYRTLYTNNELAIRKWHNKLKIYRLPELK